MESREAFFYEGKYYLVPEGKDFRTFIEVITDEEITLDRLNEIKCMAPYFTFDAVENVTVMLDKQKIYPLTAHLLTAGDYHNRLKEHVFTRCVNCSRFIDDDDDDKLEGHHEEISLDGVCFEKESENDPPELTHLMQYFWGLFEKNSKKIKNWIKKDDAAKIAKLFDEMLRYVMPPLQVFYKEENSKYHIYTCCFNNPLFRMLTMSLEQWMPDTLKDDFCFHPSLPEGEMEYTRLYGAGIEKGLTLKFEGGEGGNIITACNPLFADREKESDFLTAVYLYLCEKFGEDNLMFVADRLAVQTGHEESCMFPYQFFSVLSDYKEEKKKAFGLKDEDIRSVRTYELENNLPCREGNVFSSTIVPELSIMMCNDYPALLELQERYSLQTGYLAFQIKGMDIGDDAQTETVKTSIDIITEYLKEKKNSRSFGMHVGSDYICLDIAVLNKKLFKKNLRDLAPVFMKHNAKWIECTPDGFAVYKLTYIPEIIDVKAADIQG